MKHMRALGVLGGLSLVFTGLLSPVSHAATPTDNDGPIQGVSAVVPYSTDTRIANWQKLQFGLFMHWGVYSTFAGSYKGATQTIGYPEQIKAWMKIPREEYLAEAAKMKADKWDAAQVCKTAKDAGMKYVMLTTKHHDGFAMWDTKTTDYNVVKQTAFGKDPIRQLSDECSKIDMKLAFYFSIIDWEKHEAEPYGNVNPITDDHLQYNLQQIEELMTNYGPISEFWFDMGGPTAAQSEKMAQKVRELQPNTTVVNSRVWNDKGDFEVGGDNSVPPDFRMGPWESILSIFPSCWSYCNTYKANRDESRVIPVSRSAIKGLITVISGGGQYAYNIGPRGDGSFDPFDQKVLDNFATWRNRHPQAIEGAHATWFDIPSWGRVTANGHSLYLFPSSWSNGGELALPGLANSVKKVTIDGTSTELSYTHENNTLKVRMTGESPDELYPVIKVELDGEPMMIPPQTAKITEGESRISRANIVGRNSAKGGSRSVIDTYLLNTTGKLLKRVELTFDMTGNQGLSAANQYLLTFGDHSRVVTGAELAAGKLGEIFTLKPHEVTRLRLENYKPTYYANRLPIYPSSITVTAAAEEPVATAPTFLVHPENQQVRVGQTAAFAAQATGWPTPTYQWYEITPEGQILPIEGATSATYSLDPLIEDDGAQFRVVAKNSAGEATSHTATLTVLPEKQNLALKKPTRQSSTAWSGISSRANDGDTDGVWDNGSVSHTSESDENPWWETDLGDTYRVSTVDVWNRAAEMTCKSTTVPCSDRLKNFYVIASKSPVASLVTSLEEMINAEDAKAIKVEGVAKYPSSVDFGDFPARYITVVLPGKGTPLSLAEVEVFGKPDVDAPTFDPLEASGNPAEHFTSNGDGNSRTITAPVGTTVTLKLPAQGKPTPTVTWQKLTASADEWEDIAGVDGSQYAFTLSAQDDGVKVRARAVNTAGTVYSQLIELKTLVPPEVSAVTLTDSEGTGLKIDEADGWQSATVAPDSKITASVTATGKPEPTVKWQRGTLPAGAGADQIAWTDIPQAQGLKLPLTIDAAMDGTFIRAVVTNDLSSVASTPLRFVKASQPDPDQPDEPGTPEDPDTPGTPEDPDTPGTPEEPDTPGTPEDPDTPGTPEEPEAPSTPSATLEGVTGGVVSQGQSLVFAVKGFAPSEKLTFAVHSQPMTIGTVRADKTGAAKLSWTVPADFEVGAHEVIVTGENGKQARAAFTVVAKDTIPGGTSGKMKPNSGKHHSGKMMGQRPLATTGAGLETTGMLTLLTVMGAATTILGRRRWEKNRN
ncbi:alpha-L-fucosidase [Schaalia sp. ZJ1691]|uniref:alpha-L-fucosidase n=1 Tax=Schaalia sp. ZJ1691 TaxID=2709404 RepID=UPI0013ECE9CF|nr:alpha-L-fucosidase [Schaalia sp. ZJ1691]